MISSYIVDCNILTDDCPFYCCIFWGTCIYQFSHAEEFVQNIRGSLLTKDGLCKFLHRGDAPEPAEALLFWLLPAAWLNITATPKKGRKADSSRLRVRSCFFCLAYEVKPRNRPHISSLSPAGAKLERVKRDECACGGGGQNL